MTDAELHAVPHLPDIEPPSSLLDRVVQAVNRLRIRALRIRFTTMLIGLVLSLIGVILYANWFLSEIRESSFWGFLRLGLSDPDIVLTHFSDLAWGLLESIPAISVMVVLISIFFIVAAIGFGQSLRRIRKKTVIHQLTPIS